MAKSSSNNNNNNNNNNSDTAVHTIHFSLGPPSTSNPDLSGDDSALLDDNELTTAFLSPDDNDDEDADDGEEPQGPSLLVMASAAATNRHSSLRLVLRKMGNCLATAVLVTMLIIIPAVTYRELSKQKWDFAAYYSAEIMAMGTIVLSVRLIYQHFTHWYMPNVQKYVVRIIWMVPLYAIQSYLSLRFRQARIYIDAVRDLYEAYVISSFLYYLIELLGGQDALVATLRNMARQDPNAAQHLGDHGWLFNMVLQPWDLGLEFMLQCKHGVLQYVVVKACATVMTFIFQSMGVYGEGQFQWNVAYPYLAFCLNVSVMYALYCLVKLFHAINDELRHPIDWHPLGKFLCVKGVVFFTWWQGVIIYYLKAHGIIDDIGSWTGEQVANGLIDYCVCIEMVGFAIAHAYTFTYTEYLPATVQEAMMEYEQSQQNQQQQSNNGLDNASGGGGVASAASHHNNNNNNNTYRPPETLPRPMKFKDAFWSSTLPSETIRDIRRLRNGVDLAMSQQTDPGSISLRGLHNNSGDDGPSQQQPPSQSFV